MPSKPSEPEAGKTGRSTAPRATAEANISKKSDALPMIIVEINATGQTGKRMRALKSYLETEDGNVASSSKAGYNQQIDDSHHKGSAQPLIDVSDVIENRTSSNKATASYLTRVFRASAAQARDLAPAVEAFVAERLHGQSDRARVDTRGLPTERYIDRPASEDALAFYDRVWRTVVQERGLFLDDLTATDPELAPSIRARCSYMIRKHPDQRERWQARNYLPPARSSQVASDAVAERRQRGRRRQARHIAKQRALSVESS